MILAIDPGLAACGWAVVDPATALVAELGVLTTEPDKAIAKSTDRARRAHQLAAQLAELAAVHGCTVLAAEAMLLFGNVNAATAQVLCWGALLGVAHARGLSVVEVRAKDWQHDVVGPGKVNYARVEKKLTKHVGPRIGAIAKNLRTHALDAVAIGLYAALRKVPAVVKGAACRA
ncbi:MAG TPA: crossover junction endodeoxyribonuclease RuvC [Kofleriaceae bacterium]|nr:crossover junction endodeoxyribonuclease RuvC [Kofleriaceae bacterium]